MYAYEVIYKDCGIPKGKGFKYFSDFERFILRLLKNTARYKDINVIDCSIREFGKWTDINVYLGYIRNNK